MNNGRIALIVGLAIVAVGSFFVGRTLRPGPAPSYAYDLTAPAYSAPVSNAAFSQGGFSGFDEIDGFDGATLEAGRITALRPDGVDIESPDGVVASLRIGAGSNLQRIEPADRAALQPGVTVVVRADGFANGTGVLVLSTP